MWRVPSPMRVPRAGPSIWKKKFREIHETRVGIQTGPTRTTLRANCLGDILELLAHVDEFLHAGEVFPIRMPYSIWTLRVVIARIGRRLRDCHLRSDERIVRVDERLKEALA